MSLLCSTPMRAKNALQKLAVLVSIAIPLALFLTSSIASATPGDPTEHYNFTDISYKGKNVEGEPMRDSDHAMSPPMILMIMNFAIVLIIIGWKVRPPVSRWVKQRHEDIAHALDEATRLREQAKNKLDEYNEKLAEAEAEVEAIITDIRNSAEAEKKRIMEDAEAQARAMQKDAEARIAAEIARARVALRRDVVEAAIVATEKLIRVTATRRDHIALVDGFIADVQATASEERA